MNQLFSTNSDYNLTHFGLKYFYGEVMGTLVGERVEVVYAVEADSFF